MNHPTKIIKITDRVPESKACGYAGFSNGPTNITKLRANVPHQLITKNGRPCRLYLVSDCIAYKVKRESVGAIPF